jgi:phosphate transport system substrate-binding protein
MTRLLIAVSFLILLANCADRDKHGKLLDTPTSGSIKIAVDESLKPLIDAEISAFEGIYRNADIDVLYTTENDAVHQLLTDSARLSIVTRKLTEGEKQKLADQVIFPTQRLLAMGGVALIRNRNATDSTLSWEGLQHLLSGTSTSSEIVVFDQPNSGIIRFLRDTLLLPDSLPDNCFAVKGNANVIRYVSSNRSALGLIDLSWISDHDDATAKEFLDIINVVAVETDSGAYLPYQAYIAQRKYPLLRDVVVVSREARAGLASGFIAFMASDKGQRIVLKSGLVPATMPLRIVEINHEPF